MVVKIEVVSLIMEGGDLSLPLGVEGISKGKEEGLCKGLAVGYWPTTGSLDPLGGRPMRTGVYCAGSVIP
jgi:hypothetical protein